MDNTPVTLSCGSTHNFYDSGGNTGGNHDYANSLSLIKTFTAGTSGQCITVTFTAFNTENCCDYLRIYDGPNTGSPMLGQYQGSPTVPFTLTSTSGTLTFQFVSDGSVVASGWVAIISCVTCPPPSTNINMNNTPVTVTCGTTYNFYDSGGSGGSYSSNENFTKTFTAGTSGQCLTVTFTSFNTENCCDYLRVFDGPTTGSPMLGQYQGSPTVPFTLTSTSGTLTFQFVSDGSVVGTGWAATISCTSSCAPPPPCGYNMNNTNVTLTCPPACLKFFDSGGGAGNYSNSESFTKTFTAPAGYCLSFNFVSFLLESCCDQLQIYDGPNTASPLIGTYTGTSPGLITSTSGSLTFRFTSDGSVTYSGWEANISCVASCSSAPVAGTAVASPVSSCGTFTTTLSLTGASSGCGLTYQWQSSPNNSTWTNIAGATSSTYNATVTANTYYRCVVSCGASSSNSSSVYVTINPTSVGTGTVLVSSLPYFSPARSTCGKVNDLTSANVPVACGSTSYLGGEDEVFVFTPTTSGSVTIDLTNASTTSAGIKLYQGCPLSASATCIGNASGSANLTICVNVTSGVTYYLVVDVSPSPTCYTYDISITAPTGISSGNNCVDATIIPALPYTQSSLSTCCKGNDYTSSNACGSSYMNGEDYVFRYTPATNQIIDISLGGTLSSTGLFITNGCPNVGTCVAQANGTNPFLCGVNLTGGVTYYIIVDTWPSPACTPFNIDIRQQTSIATCNLAYSNTSISYSPDSYLTGTSITMGDDRFSASYIPIGFNFCFDGRLYTQCLISSNGYIIFDRVGCTTNLPTDNATPDGYSPYSITATNAPNTTNAPRNVIMGPWQDIYPAIGGAIRYQTLGTAPNRRFVVSYYQIPMFSCTGDLFTGQIKLFETTNNIEIHLGNKTICAGFNSGRAILGLHNYNGTLAVIPTNRNTSPTWATSNEAWRFSTTCTTCVPLPVELVEFDGRREEGVNKIHWTTLTEINNDFFTLERSEDAENFYEIAKIKGAGNSNTTLNYSFIDRKIANNIEYYRLKQTDFDGSFYYSHIIAISDKNIETLKVKNIYPNPTTNDFNIDVVTNLDDNLLITLTDIYGKKLQEFETVVNTGNNTIKINTDKIERGVIFVNISSKDNNINLTQKIVKQ
ncbi:MAG: CUB domain-containing protein [Bacteroidia bacterium]